MPLISNVGLILSSDSPANLDAIAAIVERTKNEQKRWLQDETGHRFEYKLDAIRSEHDSTWFMQDTDDLTKFHVDPCGNGVHKGRVDIVCGYPDPKWAAENRLNWAWSVDGGSHPCHRRDMVYLGKWANGWAGGAGNYELTDKHDGSMTDAGWCLYGGRNYWYLAGLGSSDCGGTFMNLTRTQFAHDHSHEGMHHYGVECHLKKYTPPTSMRLRDAAVTLGISVRAMVENQFALPLPPGLRFNFPFGETYTTSGGETMPGIMAHMGYADRQPDPDDLPWPYILEFDKPRHEQMVADVVIPAGQMLWYPSALWLGEPLQEFQREMFITNSGRFLEKVPVTLPIPTPEPSTPPPPVVPPPPPPEPLTVTPTSAIVHRYFGKRSVTVTTNKPITRAISQNAQVATVTITGPNTAKIAAGTASPQGSWNSGGTFVNVALASGTEKVFVGTLLRW